MQNIITIFITHNYLEPKVFCILLMIFFKPIIMICLVTEKKLSHESEVLSFICSIVCCYSDNKSAVNNTNTNLPFELIHHWLSQNWNRLCWSLFVVLRVIKHLDKASSVSEQQWVSASDFDISCWFKNTIVKINRVIFVITWRS